jgi:hypothetical protein
MRYNKMNDDALRISQIFLAKYYLVPKYI